MFLGQLPLLGGCRRLCWTDRERKGGVCWQLVVFILQSQQHAFYLKSVLERCCKCLEAGRNNVCKPKAVQNPSQLRNVNKVISSHHSYLPIPCFLLCCMPKQTPQTEACQWCLVGCILLLFKALVLLILLQNMSLSGLIIPFWDLKLSTACQFLCI